MKGFETTNQITIGYIKLYLDCMPIIFLYWMFYVAIYIYMVVVDQNSFIQERPFFAINILLSRNFRKLHVYL